MGDSIKSLTPDEMDNTSCFCLICGGEVVDAEVLMLLKAVCGVTSLS